MNTIDEIALRVAEKLEPRGRTYSPDHYIEFAHALLAELSKDEPVGWMTTGGGIAKDKAFFIELGAIENGYNLSTGRPREMESGRRVNLYLDQSSKEIAARIGNGNVSEGIRKALKASQ